MMRFLALGSLPGLVLLIGCAGEDLSSGDPGAQGGAGTSQGGQAGAGVGGDASGGSGQSGQGAAGSSASGQAGSEQAGGGQAGGDQGPGGASGQAGDGQGGLSGSSGQAGAGGDPVPMAGQGGSPPVAGQAGSGGEPPTAGQGGAAGSSPEPCSCLKPSSCYSCFFDSNKECKPVVNEGAKCSRSPTSTEQNGVCDGEGHCASADAATMGCADGTRESALPGPDVLPDLAACQGAWSVAGIKTSANAPATGCQRRAGNAPQYSVLDGQDCTSADLCAYGWHVCRDADDVTKRAGSVGNVCQKAANSTSPQFYATGQATDSLNNICLSIGTKGVVGCGASPYASPGKGCNPLNSFVHQNATGPVGSPWTFSGDGAEQDTVIKKQGFGGVLCCRN